LTPKTLTSQLSPPSRVPDPKVSNSFVIVEGGEEHRRKDQEVKKPQNSEPKIDAKTKNAPDSLVGMSPSNMIVSFN